MTEDEERFILSAGPTWLRLLQSMEDQIINTIYGEFQQGRLEQVKNLASFASVRSQINQIKTVLSNHKEQS